MKPDQAGAWLGHDGIEMRDEAQLDRLRRWRAYGGLFASLRADPTINVGALGSDFVENGWFHTPDVETYAAMIGDERPAVVLEVGGGYSTLVARRALDELGLGSTRVVVVDPEPRLDIGGAADVLLRAPVQDCAVEELLDGASFLLFVDSSHVAVPGGDVPFLYEHLVPGLPSGSLVHVHDVFIPFDYRPDYVERGYTEQYVVHELLAQNTFSVEFASVYLSWRHPSEMRATFGASVPERHAGASLWFRTG